MKRETFIALLSATLAEADAELLSEARNLLGWRERELRTARVREFAPGDNIEYLAKDGKTHLFGTVDHLNRFSLTIRYAEPLQGFRPEVVPIERVLGFSFSEPLT